MEKHINLLHSILNEDIDEISNIVKYLDMGEVLDLFDEINLSEGHIRTIQEYSSGATYEGGEWKVVYNVDGVYVMIVGGYSSWGKSPLKSIRFVEPHKKTIEITEYLTKPKKGISRIL
jgi:hypothetical protein